MKSELIKRNKYFESLYKKENELIHLGDFGTFRLLTEHSDLGDSITEIKDTLQFRKIYSLAISDIPFAQEFDFSDNDKILMLTEDNKISFIDLNSGNSSYKIISNSVEELFGIHYQIDFIISQGYNFQIITKAQKIDNIIPRNRFFNLEEGREYYEFDDYIKLLQDILNLNKDLRDKFSVGGQEIRLDGDTKYVFSVTIEERSFKFEFLDSEQPNTINSDDGYLNGIFLDELNDIFQQIEADYFFIIVETQRSIPANMYGQYVAFVSENEYQSLLKHNFRVLN